MSQRQAKLGNIPLGLLEGWINGREALASCSPAFAMAAMRRAASLWASRTSGPGCSFFATSAIAVWATRREGSKELPP